MKKLSKLTESIWSDIQDRSGGEIGRKEDDIDLLDIKEFCEYLNCIYKTDSDDDIRILEIEDDHKIDTYLVICLYEDEKGYYRYIYYDGIHINTQLDVIEILNCRFEFERKFSTIHTTNDFDVVCIDIYPKDKARVPVTNKFFIEVLDFLLDRINTPLEQQIEKITDVKESIWSDIQDRSGGDTVRKEDDIRDLKPEEFVYYLREIYDDGSDKGFGYKGVNPARYGIMVSYSSKYIDITIPFDVVDDIISDYRIVRRLYIEINNTTYEYEPIAITDGEDIEELLSKNGYVFEKRLPPDSSRVYPKKGKTTNQTVINLIDLLITNAKEPMLKRK